MVIINMLTIWLYINVASHEMKRTCIVTEMRNQYVIFYMASMNFKHHLHKRSDVHSVSTRCGELLNILLFNISEECFHDIRVTQCLNFNKKLFKRDRDNMSHKCEADI